MGIFGSEEQGKAFELVPEGKHVGVVRFVVNCGHHRDSYQGKANVKHLIFVGWELNCKDSDGNPHWKGDFYTASDFIQPHMLSNGKPNPRAGEEDWLWASTSNFSKILRAWTGKDEKTVQWKTFLEHLVSSQFPCYVTIEHTEDKKDTTKKYSNIDSIKPVKNGEKYERIGKVVAWGFGKEGLSQEGLEDLPGNIRKKINASIEKTEGGYKVPPKEPKQDKPTHDNGGDDDGIPF